MKKTHPCGMKIFTRSLLFIILIVCLAPGYAIAGKHIWGKVKLSDIEMLGKFVFFDQISNPAGAQGCSSCHDPQAGWTFPDETINAHQVAAPGAVSERSGTLKTPANAYATFIGPFVECGVGGPGGGFCGGNFWDGRAEGAEPALFPDTASRHVGSEVFYTTEGNLIPGIDEYDEYIGPVTDQALNPFPNPVEQNISRKEVCEHVASSSYAKIYKKAWGVAIDCSDDEVAVSAPDVPPDEYPEKAYDISFKRIAMSLGAYQASFEVNSFTSKRDFALEQELACACAEGSDSVNYPGEEICAEIRVRAKRSICLDDKYINSPGKFPLVGLTDQENLGHDLFYNVAPPFGPPVEPPFPELPVTQCAFCHSDGPDDDGAELRQLYADDGYHNIGTPYNPEIPGMPPASRGLAGHTNNPPNTGSMKTPTLRNVNKRPYPEFIKAYAHNGWFKSMESIVHFYNTARVDGATAASFGITRCVDEDGNPQGTTPENSITEKEALERNCWPTPAIAGGPGGINPFVGDLGMNAEQEAALVAYLATLTDLYTPTPPKYRKQNKVTQPKAKKVRKRIRRAFRH